MKQKKEDVVERTSKKDKLTARENNIGSSPNKERKKIKEKDKTQEKNRPQDKNRSLEKDKIKDKANEKGIKRNKNKDKKKDNGSKYDYVSFMKKKSNPEQELIKIQRKHLILAFLTDPLYTPMKEKEIAVLMQVSKTEREQFSQLIQELNQEGSIEISSKGKIFVSSGEKLIGKFISHSKGFGFVEIEGREDDLFIPEDHVNGAFHQDTVEARIITGQKGKRQEAEIVRIVSRGMNTIIGTYEQSKSNFGFVIPDNQKIASDVFIPRERSKGAVQGHKVVVEITDYGKDNKKPEGKVIEILGHMDDPGVDIISIIKGYDIPTVFGEKVMNQVERIPAEVQAGDLEGRMDLRFEQTVTIDGEDAKDLDDAISLTMEGDCYRLGVHIADVSNYVQENSALDRSALERATSVYLVDRVVPMLPHQLSNGICSLNQGVDRLALSCIMLFDAKGMLMNYKIAETVINVDRRMTYTKVAAVLDGEQDAISEYQEFVPMFERMRSLAGLLREKRKKRGSIDFDFPESKIILDREGHPVEIKPYDRNIATKIIEDFMLAANETVAEHFYWLEYPFVYRTHDNPDPEKIKQLSLFISNFGYSIKTTAEEVHPKEFQKLLAKIDGTSEEALISRLTLRSMRQAKYTTECTGHFGLACEYYCHFTSPIRRYPDLQIHRIIKDHIRGRMNPDKIEYYKDRLPEVAKQSSAMERRADEAERETDKLKKVEYMEARIGEVYEGVISGITNWGIYVELPNTVEGMIRASDLMDDFYVYDDKNYEMTGQRTGKKYKLGEKILIQVYNTDRISRTIDFRVAQQED